MSETVSPVSSTHGLASVPRAVWIGGGLLALVTAGLAGALVMKSVQPGPQPDVQTAAQLAPAVPPAPAGATAPTDGRHGTVQPAAGKSVAHAGTGGKSAARTADPSPPIATTRTVACPTCGTVESVNAVQLKGEGTGLGAVAGGVLGGVVGHQVGGGNGKTAMTVLGAIGGGLAGNEVERRTHSETLYDIHVRMEDGSQRVIRRTGPMALGTPVVVEGEHLRVATVPPAVEPGMTRTSAPAARGT